MDDDKVNALVVFLSNPNRKAEDHVETVMEMVREISKYKHELAETRRQRDTFGEKINAMSRVERMGFDEDPLRHSYNPRQLTIPTNARSVEVKF